MASAGTWKSLPSSTCITKKLEWLGIQHAVENKDVSWNSAFSRRASTESRENIHWNQTKENMPIKHGQLPHKDRIGQFSNINWTVSTMWYCICREHSMRVCLGYLQWNFVLDFIIIVLTFRLCSSLIVFYTRSEVIKLAFLEDKSRCVCCIFANFIFTFETKS